MSANGGGMRSCRLRANDLSSDTSVDAGDEPAKRAMLGSFLYHVLATVFYSFINLKKSIVLCKSSLALSLSPLLSSKNALSIPLLLLSNAV